MARKRLSTDDALMASGSFPSNGTQDRNTCRNHVASNRTQDMMSTMAWRILSTGSILQNLLDRHFQTKSRYQNMPCVVVVMVLHGMGEPLQAIDRVVRGVAEIVAVFAALRGLLTKHWVIFHQVQWTG